MPAIGKYGVFCHGFAFLAAQNQADGRVVILIEGADLAIQSTGAPVLFDAFVEIPLSRGRVVDADESAVVRPTQFGTHCVPNCKGTIECSHVA